MPKQKSTTKSWISFRVKPTEYDKISRFLEATTYRKMSEYARSVLLQKPVNVRYRNQSADDFLHEMLLLKNELNAIGNNFNQAVKRLHTMEAIPEVKVWLLITRPQLEAFINKTEQIREKMNQIHEQWSSK